LQNVIYFIILAPYDNEQSDLLHRIHRDSRTSLVQLEARLLKLFTVHELMRWHLVEEQFGPHLCAPDGVFSNQPIGGDTSADGDDSGSGSGNDSGNDSGNAPAPAPAPAPNASSTPSSWTKAEDAARKPFRRWQDLRRRVIEHNVRVVARYYTRIRLPRLTYLLGLGAAETEQYLSQLVTAGTVYARIDRPAQVVSFARPRQPDDVLNEWSADMKSLLGLLERIDHLITKEEMMGALGKK
jgi:26S proteasome regulatory subunit N5